MWIEKKYKKYYNDSSVKGLRVYYDKTINYEVKNRLIDYCSWLRKTFYFPIGCCVTFVNQKKFCSIDDGHVYYAIFYNCENKKTLPKVFVATEVKLNKIKDIYFFLAHELGHYYQWYFYENERKSERSLEITATRWANNIVSLYLNSITESDGGISIT